MEMQQIIEQAERNIRQALEDYGAHTRQTDVLDDVSETFIRRLARDSSYAKQELRELFSKSPVWDSSLDALVINGTRTHNPDPEVVRGLAIDILQDAYYKTALNADIAWDIAQFFANPDDLDLKARGIEAIAKVAPKAYASGKKPSRIFKSICDALGISDGTAGSRFQRLYAQFADELAAKKISFKLFVSINPAHFLTMSNPKADERGCTLTSCHSFNSTEYEYNNGCSGYARDEVSFIVFTVDDPMNPESLNNRKTSRQVFAYKPGNGLLLQSRFYNTSGGTRGAQAESKVYRDLVQREISALEDAANLWKTFRITDGEHERCVLIGDGFGGYPDWHYSEFDAKVSIRTDHEDDWEPLVVGTYGLCICCGEEISARLYCDSCDDNGGDGWYCDDCGEWTDEDDRYYVRNSSGDEICVCGSCRDRHYTYCDQCEEYYPNDMVHSAYDSRGNLIDVCDDCLDEYYCCCDECGEYYHEDNIYEAVNEYGDHVRVCEDCRDRHYTMCEYCHEYHHDDTMAEVIVSSDGRTTHICEDCCEKHYKYCEDCSEWYDPELTVTVYDPDGSTRAVCMDCAESYEICPHCGERICRTGETCPACGAVIEEEKEAEAV